LLPRQRFRGVCIAFAARSRFLSRVLGGKRSRTAISRNRFWWDAATWRNGVVDFFGLVRRRDEGPFFIGVVESHLANRGLVFGDRQRRPFLAAGRRGRRFSAAALGEERRRFLRRRLFAEGSRSRACFLDGGRSLGRRFVPIPGFIRRDVQVLFGGRFDRL